MRKPIFLAAALGVTAFPLFAERDALACGGCFHGPSENPTVVTDHKMILSVSKDQTTLYDQIEYSGSPEAFAWVLPIAGTVKIGLSADIVFQTIDQLTQTQIQAPPMNCAGPPASCYEGFDDAGSSLAKDASAGGPGGGGVQVIERQVIGPYDTVQLASDDPNALEDWLTDNGFAITDAERPLVAAYVAEHFDFVAVKLLPSQGVSSMRPIRVTTTGASVALPLRMVAAGAGPTLGITLWVLGDGRYQPTNFDSFVIATDDIAWDWATQSSDYTSIRAAKTAAGAGKIWEIESSTSPPQPSLESRMRRFMAPGATDAMSETYAAMDYQPITAPVDADGGAPVDADGGAPDDAGSIDAGAADASAGDGGVEVVETAVQARDEDIETLFHGISNLRVTRMRADLAHDALATDLTVGASSDQSELSNIRVLTKEKGEPQCPVYSGCEQTGTAPRGDANAKNAANEAATGGSGDDSSCATGPRRASPSAALDGLVVVFAIAAVRRAIERKKRREKRP